MKIYQIVEDYSNEKHAGSKATNDAVIIMKELGAQEVPVLITTRVQSLAAKLKRQVAFFKDWQKVYQSIEPNAVLILQNPFRIRQFGRFQVLMKLKRKKNIKIISLIHDIELLRYDNHKTRKEFKETLTVADQLIVHNNKMKQWFMNQGVTENKLTVLEIFDYLSDKSSDLPTHFSKEVVIAGNLAKDKSPYVYKLGDITDVQFNLMGVNYESTQDNTNVSYKGAFEPDDVPYQLNSGFGLVWDGPSVDTCEGITGEYLRFNNPHKLSLYISSSLPVVIWSEAAEASFVESNGLGLTVSSLYDLKAKLEAVTEIEYQEMVANTKAIKEQLQSGYYLRKAISKALSQL